MVRYMSVADTESEIHANCVKCQGQNTTDKIIKCSNASCRNIRHVACSSPQFLQELPKKTAWFCSTTCGNCTEPIDLDESISDKTEGDNASAPPTTSSNANDRKVMDHLQRQVEKLTKTLNETLVATKQMQHNLNAIQNENAMLREQIAKQATPNENKHDFNELSGSDEPGTDEDNEVAKILKQANETINAINTGKLIPEGKNEAPLINAFNHDTSSYLASSDGCSNATLQARNRVRLRREKNKDFANQNALQALSTKELSRLKLARQHLSALRKFKGDRFEWIAFEEEVYTTWDAGEFTDYEMIKMLRVAIEGEALNYVKLALNAGEANPEHVMETLRRKYYQPNEAVSLALQEITSLEAVRNKVRKPLENLLTAVENYIHVCNLVRIQKHLSGRINGEVEAKLPNDLRADWNKLIRTGVHDDGTRYVGTWLEFWQFLRDSVADLPISTYQSSGGSSHFKKFTNNRERQRSTHSINNSATGSQNKNTKFRKSNANNDSLPAKTICPYDSCDKGKLYQCSAFWLLPHEEKMKFVNSRKFCYRCVNSIEHNAANCPLASLQCKIPNCSDPKGHATILHSPKKLSCHIRQLKGFTAFQVVPVFIYDVNNNPVKVLAFLDGGSDTTILDHNCFKSLKIPSDGYHLDVAWCAAGVSSVDKASRIFDLKISSVDTPGIKFTLRDVVTMKNLKLPKQGQDPLTIKREFHHLKRVPIPAFDPETPKILIGLQQKHLISASKCIRTEGCPVVAELTSLGWTISGSIRPGRYDKGCTLQSCAIRDDENECTNEELTVVIRKFIDEDMALMKPRDVNYLTPEEQRANKLRDEHMTVINNRYFVGFYWKSDKVELPDNYELAKSRLISQELRLKKLDMVDWANSHMQMLLDRGFARKATQEDLYPDNPHENINYVMGFVTFNQNKVPPKPRWVVDPASTFKGYSLNSALLKGPDNLVPLTQALFHFRERAIAIVADVEKMYHQVMILPQYQNCQRFLWRWCKSDTKPEIFIHQAMMFGPTDSPSKANAVRIDHAQRSVGKFPNASRIALDSMYMDDAFNSEDTVEEAVAASNEIIAMFDEISWKLVDFRSNSPNVLKQLPSDRVNENFVIDLSKDETIDKYKVLGIFWDPKIDCFIFKQTAEFTLKTKTQKENYVPNKRELLSFVMRIYDPLGLISHFIVRGRMIMQTTWANKIDWSDKVSDETFGMWKIWLDGIDQLSRLRIPRFYKINSDELKCISLQVFSDAGADGLATVAYFRFEFEDEHVHVQQIAAKTKVAPIRYLSIAKRELAAAVASTKLVKLITKQHKRIKPSLIVYYTDSEITLKWIRNPTLKLMQYVAPRVTEIWDNSEVNQWRYVPTIINPADHGTKWRQNPIDYSDHRHKWFQGPDFLWEPKINYPADAGHSDTTKVTNRVMVIHPNNNEKYYAGILEFVNATVRANWPRYVTAIAGVMRFTNNCKLTIRNKRNDKFTQEHITPEERESAMRMIIKNVQEVIWPEAFTSLSRGHFVKSRNSIDINALNPFLGKDGLLRAITRMSHEEMIPYDKRYPIILPAKHEVTDSIVRHYHIRNFHIGHETVIARLREKFWIIHARQAVRRISAQCLECKIFRAKPYETPRAPLPEVRVTPTTKAFENVGADVFGPFTIYTRRSKCTRQVWCVIFCCLVTRAVFLRMIDSLSADEMMLAIQDLWTRRGPVKQIYSDNGTNFIKCAKLLRTEIQMSLAKDKGITWHFNPPYTPQWGGAWERLIKDIKRALKHAIRGITIGEKVFQCVLLQIEEIMNERPLTHLPVSPDDDSPLTPNQLIKLHPGYELVLTESGDFDSNETLKKAQWYAGQFRKRWVREYLPIIAKHPAKGNKRESIKEGDLVILIDSTKNPSMWPKAVVVKVYPGRDGCARVADIKLPDGSIIERRSAQHLAKLNLHHEAHQNSAQRVINSLFTSTLGRNVHFTFEHASPIEVRSEKEESESSHSLNRTFWQRKQSLLENNQIKVEIDFETSQNCAQNMKFTPENAITLARSLVDAKFFKKHEIAAKQEGSEKILASLHCEVRVLDHHSRYTIKLLKFPAKATIYDLIIWLTTLNLRPEWIAIENINNKILHIFIRNPDRAINDSLIRDKEHKLVIDGQPIITVKFEATATTTRNNFNQPDFEHTLLVFRPQTDVRERKLIISRVRDSANKQKAMKTVSEECEQMLRLIDITGNPPKYWNPELYATNANEGVRSRLGKRESERKNSKDKVGHVKKRLASVVVVSHRGHCDEADRM